MVCSGRRSGLVFGEGLLLSRGGEAVELLEGVGLVVSIQQAKTSTLRRCLMAWTLVGSLRGGGACHHLFRVERSPQFAGRWKRPETLRHYLQEALAVHALANAPASARELLATSFEHVHRLQSPPLGLGTIGESVP